MHILKVTLKQHTPLIHFHHDQDGATLRASEVKPKLDRFILSRLTTEQRTQGEKEGWVKQKNDKVWLDYKMRIVVGKRDETVSLRVSEKRGKYITDDFPFLLANMGGKETREELMNLSFYDSVRMQIQIQSDFLTDLIIKNIEIFFANHNFGQRQTKGFGSFSVIKKQIDNNQEELILWDANDYYENGTQLMSFPLNENDNVFNKQFMLFSVIDFYWRCLKSGVNYTKRIPPKNGLGNVIIKYPERYIKAYLWTYLNLKGKTWEKRRLKNEFGLETSYPLRTYNDNPNTAIFARGMMGCPDKYEYRLPNNRFRYIKKDNKYKEEIETKTIFLASETIERIASPIAFKPIVNGNEVSVYILLDSLLIDKLKSLPENDRMYSFSVDNRKIQLSIDPNCMDYRALINGFHRHVFTDNSFIQSTIGYYDERQRRWQPARITIIKDEAEKVISRNYGNTNISWKMVPRNYRWENILDPNDNGQNKYVSFLQIAK